MTADEKRRYDYLTFIRYSFFCCLTKVHSFLISQMLYCFILKRFHCSAVLVVMCELNALFFCLFVHFVHLSSRLGSYVLLLLFFYSWRKLNGEIEMVWKATLTKVPEIPKLCLNAE